MESLKPQDALLIADVQNDFLPGGALGIRGGDEIPQETTQQPAAHRTGRSLSKSIMFWFHCFPF